jgi:hypothetical protein
MGEAGLYFCSSGCQGKFEASPGRYLGARPAVEPMATGTQVYLPDASGGRALQAWFLSDLWHGAGTDGRADG